ncbi:hypothetical protein ILUMI_02789 [Ignelater luminosus]|uniref:S-adenosylmethionine mitochondrial carrier protein n=1 Tax=Ignelater luminosus TaxID=2038154 RepID=A0A8K0DHK4_IGNLU|nr:hypothetical protein ILUMI_02789 [Ignelater luminosus]
MVDRNLFVSSLCAGGIAGFVVDVVLFPLDTLKTRLQASQGFWKCGGFKGIYKGIGPQAIGSAPQAAIFFCTYETFKAFTTPLVSNQFHPLIHMTGASIAEVVCCLVRVPVEVVKQRRQTMLHVPGKPRMCSLKIFIHAYKTEGIIGGLYRGYGSTVIREIPFSFIQFPILEYLKVLYSQKFKNNIELEPWEVAICGSIAGGTAAAVTTPLDVIKTRIMLAPSSLAKKTRCLKSH